jgi:glycosyltransferase involved in cell wall biosynthesis
MMPEVSVVVATRDRLPLLQLALRSVARQRDVHIETVVVDDASSDATAQAVTGRGDARVRVVRHERSLGVSGARNTGIAQARGRWVAFLDDDDVWSPDKLAAQLAAAERQGRRWAVSGAVCVDDALRVLVGEPPLSPEQMVADLGRYNTVPVGASNVVVRRDVLDEVGHFDRRLRHMADWELWIRLARTGLPAVVPRPHVAYRLHLAAATIGTAHDPVEPITELDLITRRHGIPADRAAVYRWIGWSALRAGRRRTAVAAYARAARDGDRKSLARAALAVVHPGVGRRIFFSPVAIRGQDEAWLDEAREWLRDLARD